MIKQNIFGSMFFYAAKKTLSRVATFKLQSLQIYLLLPIFKILKHYETIKYVFTNYFNKDNSQIYCQHTFMS